MPRSTYSLRHTYATLRLQEGVDVYFLAEQMRITIHMIESHYGRVNTIKHADRVLQGDDGMGTAATGLCQGQGVEGGRNSR